MRIALLLTMLIGWVAIVAAHPTSIAAAKAKVGADGSVELHVRFDILAFALEELPADVNDEAMLALLKVPTERLEALMHESKDRFVRSLQVTSDKGLGRVQSVAFPSGAEIDKWRLENGPEQLPVMMTVAVRVQLPEGSRTVAHRFAETLGTVILTTELSYQEPVSEPVEAGAPSSSLNLPTKAQIDAAARDVREQSAAAPVQGKEAKQPKVRRLPDETPRSRDADKMATLQPVDLFRALGEEIEESTGGTSDSRGADKMSALQPVDLFGAIGEQINRAAPDLPPAVRRDKPQKEIAGPAKLPSQSKPWYEVLPSYIELGFVHIVPRGLDHILFVLGLFLLSTRWKDLLKQVTAFTVAHSLTLALAMLGLVRLPASIVEPLIALSIVLIAVENVVTNKLLAWRPYIVFGFGLVHGLGFAGVLQDAGLAEGDFLTALLGFNIGVELGQLAAVGAAFLLVGWFQSSEKYRAWVTVPASVAIAAIALLWTVQRVI